MDNAWSQLCTWTFASGALKRAQNAPFAFVKFQKFSQGDPDPPPPLLQEDQKFPLGLIYKALYDTLQLRWKLDRHHWNFEGKIYIQFWGRNQQAIRNIATNIASMFTRTCRLFSIVVTSSRLSWRHQNMWATLITGATLHEVLSKFS